jgi:hypothetical protein
MKATPRSSQRGLMKEPDLSQLLASALGHPEDDAALFAWYKALAQACPLWARQQAKYPPDWGPQPTEWTLAVTPWRLMSERVETEFPSSMIVCAPDHVADLAWCRLYLEYVQEIPSPEQMVPSVVAGLSCRQDSANWHGVRERLDAVGRWVGAGAEPEAFKQVKPLVYGKARRGPKAPLPTDVMKTLAEDGEEWVCLVRRWRRRRRSLSPAAQGALHRALPYLSSQELDFVSDAVGKSDFDWRDVVALLLHFRRLAFPGLHATANWVFEQAFGPVEGRAFRMRESRYTEFLKEGGE